MMKKTVSLVFWLPCLVLSMAVGGCSLCCAPYDYCGPVFADGRCANLARQRCGTAFNLQAGCNGGVPQVVYDENGQRISVPVEQLPMMENQQNMQPTPSPEYKTPMPPGGHLYKQPSTAQRSVPQSMPQSQFQQASAYNTAQKNMALAQNQPSTMEANLPTASAMPIQGTISVNADGYQRVAVYDENQQLLGYEMIDATGKSIQQLPAPAHVQ